MTEVIERTMSKINYIAKPTLEEYFESDAGARNFAASLKSIVTFIISNFLTDRCE
jgi:1-deoxy-D-xylulose-5-phosphate reductoisomerase